MDTMTDQDWQAHMLRGCRNTLEILARLGIRRVYFDHHSHSIETIERRDKLAAKMTAVLDRGLDFKICYPWTLSSQTLTLTASRNRVTGKVTISYEPQDWLMDIMDKYISDPGAMPNINATVKHYGQLWDKIKYRYL